MWTCWCELHVLPRLAPNLCPFTTPSQPGQFQSEHNGSEHLDAWKQPTKQPARAATRARPWYCTEPFGTEALELSPSHRAAQKHTTKQPKPLQIFMSLRIGKLTSCGTASGSIRLHLPVTTSVNNMMAPSHFHTISINCRFSNRIPESHKTVGAISSGGPLHIFKTHQDFWCSLRYQCYFYLAWMPVQLVTHFTGTSRW